MLSFISFALLLPLSVFTLPLGPFDKPSSISCVIAGVTYPNPKHTLMLLDRRAAVPPLGLSERTFADLLVWCHEYHRSTSGVLLSRQEPNCAAGAGGTASQSTPPPTFAPHGSNDPGNTGGGRPTSTSSSTPQPGSAADISRPNDAPTHQGNGAVPHGSSDPSDTGRGRLSNTTAQPGSTADISGPNDAPPHQGNGATPHGSGDRGDTGRGRPSSTSSSTAQPGSAADTSGTNDAPTAQGNGAAPHSDGHRSQSASPGSGSRSGAPPSPTTGDGATVLRVTVPLAILSPAPISTNPSPSNATPSYSTTSEAATATEPPCPPGQRLVVTGEIREGLVDGTICVAV
ncbi:hypothetical protein BDN67DRAFT_962551 [Paxillus ammoniavirescens]|nr:hypothetical protein BDN67DRAFT_962551 [Paxillus ammoniavirescens]